MQDHDRARNAAPPTRLAIAGAGLIGRRHAAAIDRTPGVTLDAVVDPAPEGRAWAEARGIACFDDIEALFAQRRPEGVILATPTPLHAEQGLACVRHRCPALIEKPLTVTADEARPLVDAAEEAGVPLLTGHHRRHNPLIAKAREIIQKGRIGEIRAVQATCWFYKPDHYFAAAPWRTKPGAGPISVNLVHDVDLLRHLCGEVVTVQARATPSRRGHANEDLAAALLTFENGALGTLTVADGIVAPWSWEFTASENPAYPATSQSAMQIGGSHGALSIPDLTLWTHEGARDWMQPISATTTPHDSADPLDNQIAQLVAVIEGREDPLVSGREGLRSLQVVEAIAISAASGEMVEIAP